MNNPIKLAAFSRAETTILDQNMVSNILRDTFFEHGFDKGSPEEKVKIGNKAIDMQKGQPSGCMMRIGITSGFFSRQEFPAINPTLIFDSLSEIAHMAEGELTKIA